MSLAEARRAFVARVGATPENPDTVAQLLEEYLVLRKHRLKTSTVDDYRWTLKHYAPDFLKRPAASVTYTDISQLYESVLAKSVARAVYLLRILSAIYAVPVLLGKLATNPVKQFRAVGQIVPVPVRHRLIPRTLLPEFFAALPSLPRDARDWATLALLLGFRSAPLYKMRVEQYCKSPASYLLDEVTAKNREAVAYPVPKHCASIIDARLDLAAVRSSGWLFPGEGRTGHAVDFSASWESLSAKIGKKVSPHDFRRTRATVGGTLGFSTITLKRILTHKLDAAPIGDQVTGGYYVSDTEQLRPHVQLLEDRLIEFGHTTGNIYRMHALTSDPELNMVDVPGELFGEEY